MHHLCDTVEVSTILNSAHPICSLIPYMLVCIQVIYTYNMYVYIHTYNTHACILNCLKCVRAGCGLVEDRHFNSHTVTYYIVYVCS